MADTIFSTNIDSVFFNSVNGDRKYNANHLCKWLSLIVGNGVFQKPSDQLKVTAATGSLAVNVASGFGFIDGHYLHNQAVLNIPLTAAHIENARKDIIFIRLEETERRCTIGYRSGTAATNPVIPAFNTNPENYKELVIAIIDVPAGATSLSASNITDTRFNSAYCGAVTGAVDQLDTTELFTQWQTAFNAWFNEVKDTVASVTLTQELKVLHNITTSTSDIPISQKYDPGVDILRIYVNGDKLNESEYTVSADGSYFTITGGSLVAGTKVEVIVLHNVDGTGIETVPALLNQVSEDLTELKTYIFNCNGSNDNIRLSDLAQNILNGAGAWGTLGANAQIKIDVRGKFGVSGPYSGSGSTAAPYIYFKLGLDTDASRKIIFDFSNCERINIVGSNNVTVFSGADINIVGMQLVVTGVTAARMFAAGSAVDARDCKLWLTGSGQIIFTNKGYFKRCRINVQSTASNAYLVYGDTEVVDMEYCELYAITRASGSVSYCVYMTTGSSAMVRFINCSAPTVLTSGYYQTRYIHANAGYVTTIGDITELTNATTSNSTVVREGYAPLSKTIIKG